MISISKVSKKFDDVPAVADISLDIRDASVFGLIGTNGAGKSTLMRMICGVLKPDNGSITIDNIPVYDNTQAKSLMFFISDEPYYFSNATIEDMEKYYSSVYKLYDKEKFYCYVKRFELPEKRKISTFSKGMKKQISLIAGIASGCRYLLCDETFDGLDPVIRQGIKGILAGEMAENGLTPIIASHNLRELEDICDYIGLLHKGGVLLQRDLEDMKCSIQKIQCVFASDEEAKKAFSKMEILKDDKRGSLHTMTVRGSREDIEAKLSEWSFTFCEILPLTLEEIFISETEVVGYDIKKLIFG